MYANLKKNTKFDSGSIHIPDKYTRILMVTSSTYKRPTFLFNRHLETIYPALFRRVDPLPFRRERIRTPDGDFLDLDWLAGNDSSLVIICHGLEGDSRRPYMQGMARAVNSRTGKPVLAWNYRGCSGEMNSTNRFYHSGATEDLETVIQHAQSNGFTEVHLIGFSLGGNIVLKYAGERETPELKSVVALSVPVHLESSSRKMMKWYNFAYTQRFLKSLKQKVRSKNAVIPVNILAKDIDKLDHIFHFDDVVTAPIHGFKDASDYYTQCSSLYFLPRIRVPTRIINAQNDPFLSEECFPVDVARAHPFINLDMPLKGGHVGFYSKGGLYWSEEQVVEFLTQVG